MNDTSRSYSILIALLLATALAGTLALGQLKINSFSGNGTLSWSDPGGAGTHYGIQWSPSLEGSNWMSWQDAVSQLTGLGPTGMVSVPMFYRVVNPDPTYVSNATYSYYYQTLAPFKPTTALASNEMRITFMGSMIPLPVRRAQAEMSVFVEVGWVPDPADAYYHGRALDQFLFDCGTGVSANYAAASVGYRRMDKIFLSHLHGDHMGDLCQIYCFGPSSDRWSPLFIFGQSPSRLDSPPGSNTYYEDGVSNFCYHAREAWRWHSESFSFLSTSYVGYTPPTKESWGLPVAPVPVSNDTNTDGYAMIPIQLEWDQIGIAYSNQVTGARVTHYPVIHSRKGSMGYKLEWTPPGTTNTLTIIYSGDTKPETNSVDQACNHGKGIDVFIHEMVIPPDMWAWKQMGLSGPPSPSDGNVYDQWVNITAQLQRVQDSSHTSQGAYGYLLSQIHPPPRLAVATHFPVADDTVASAFASVQAHFTNAIVLGHDIVWSFDLMVLRVFPDHIEQYRADANDYAFNPPIQYPFVGTNSVTLNAPKYSTNGVGNPFMQLDTSTAIPAVDNGTTNYNPNGY
jgi:ribonuclease Z